MIKLLDSSTINKIAAGEVIERPFSVIKELIENSIDADSRKISVEIKNGGTSFIRVTDNGQGIAAEDIEYAFKSHATSKLSSITDLSELSTLGFRGEALASIASVSQLEITSKTAAQAAGVRMEIFGGEIISRREIACNTGTSITTRNLFYNTPARKKFLKSTSAETAYISDFIMKAALSKPDISFRLINGNAEVLFTSGNGDLKTAIFSVYGMDYAEKVLKVEHKINDDITISGYIGKQEISRTNRSYEDIFVNGRYVRDKIVRRAVEDAYRTYLTTGKFPAFVLNITIDPKQVDVNAHPQKLEIRFCDEQEIYQAVYTAVSSVLKSAVLVQGYEFVKPAGVDSMEKEDKKDEEDNKDKEDIKDEEDGEGGIKDEPVLEGYFVFGEDIDSDKGDDDSDKDGVDETDTVYYSDNLFKKGFPLMEAQVLTLDRHIEASREISKSEAEAFEAVKYEAQHLELLQKSSLFDNCKIIGQVFLTYWLVEASDKLYIIDQHAAHERILFERISERIKGGDVVSQALIVTERVNLSEREKAAVIENGAYLEALGFEFEVIAGEIFLKSLPMILAKPEKNGMFITLAGALAEGASANARDDFYGGKIDDLAKIACKAAVKGNDTLSQMEARAIIDELLKLDNPFNCPHGRPTIIEISKYEMERKFKRV